MFKNPNYANPAVARYTKYKPFIDEFLAKLPAEQESFSFDEVRQYFAAHENEQIALLSAEMTDGLLDDLCQRHGLQPSQ